MLIKSGNKPPFIIIIIIRSYITIGICFKTYLLSIFLENHQLFCPPSIPRPTTSDKASMECALDTSCVVDGVGVDKSKSDLISSSTSTNGSVHYSRSVSKMIYYSSLFFLCMAVIMSVAGLRHILSGHDFDYFRVPATWRSELSSLEERGYNSKVKRT